MWTRSPRAPFVASIVCIGFEMKMLRLWPASRRIVELTVCLIGLAWLLEAVAAVLSCEIPSHRSRQGSVFWHSYVREWLGRDSDGSSTKMETRHSTRC